MGGLRAALKFMQNIHGKRGGGKATFILKIIDAICL
jgi:molybdopterin-guanine dinucleotide biosynthesis protein